MQKAVVTIRNKLGLHARPASKLVKTASSGSSKVHLEKNGKRVNGHSILGLMLLEAESGSQITVEVIGDDEELILQKIVELIESGFGEE